MKGKCPTCYCALHLSGFFFITLTLCLFIFSILRSSSDPTKPRRKRGVSSVPPPSEEEKKDFLSGLSEISHAVALSLFHETCDAWKATRPKTAVLKVPQPDELQTDALPEPLTSLYSDDHQSLDESDLREKISNIELSCSAEEVDYLERITKAQASSLTWKQQRIGRITASVAHSVLHTRMDNPSKSLIRSICTHPAELHTAAIEWGKTHEEDGLKEYQQTLKENHQSLQVQKTGLRISLQNPFLGASPDGKVVCDCHPPKLIEVKCPYTLREMCEKDAANSKGFPIDDDGKVKHNHRYYTQIQMQLYVWDMEQCDLVIWTPQWIKVATVVKDSTFIEDMVSTCKIFFEQHLLPLLLTGTQESTGDAQASATTNAAATATTAATATIATTTAAGATAIATAATATTTTATATAATANATTAAATATTAAATAAAAAATTSTDTEELYCSCKSDLDSDLIGCDSVDCKIEWFHLVCVGLKRAPKGTWYCPTCRKANKKKK